LNATQNGQSFNEDLTIKVCYETSWLEDAILGALKERLVDRGLSDYSKAYFSGGQNLYDYNKFILAEWTSHSSDKDDGKRLNEHDALIKRYFPRKGLWSSRFNQDKRSGRIHSDLLTYWSKQKDNAQFKITLNTFNISVE
jgi:hypothetical protein